MGTRGENVLAVYENAVPKTEEVLQVTRRLVLGFLRT